MVYKQPLRLLLLDIVTTTREYSAVMLSVAFVSVSVCSVMAVTFESFYLQMSVLVRRHVFRICRSRTSIKVIGRSQGHTSVA